MPINDSNDPIAIPITGELDLHTFRPGDVTRLLDSYFAECAARRIHRVRVVHGKGTGALRNTVHAHLRRSTEVIEFVLGDETSGGWGGHMGYPAENRFKLEVRGTAAATRFCSELPSHLINACNGLSNPRRRMQFVEIEHDPGSRGTSYARRPLPAAADGRRVQSWMELVVLNRAHKQ